MIRSISITGCGWLGLPLGRVLAEKGYQVKGSTTKESKLDILKNAGIKPYLLQFDPELMKGDINSFLQSDLLIVNIPPSLRSKPAEYHIEQMKDLKRYLDSSSLRKLIYISSTSVYPDLDREVTEEDVTTSDQAENKTLFLAEEIFRKDEKYQSTIIRCAGLAGDDRNLVRHFAGKASLKMGNCPVNLIHREDVIQILLEIIRMEYWGHTLNICAPVHPLRKDLYPYLAKIYGYPLPDYDLTDRSSGKIIAIDKLQQELDYKFRFPDPSTFFYSP